MAFKYDTVMLLALIEERPCLWDKSIEEYKDKIMKHQAWLEVFQILEEAYDDLESKERKDVGEIIRAKWVNIKDAFFKSLKTKNSKKAYVYADHLQFLLKSKKPNTSTETEIESVEESDVNWSPIKKKSKKIIPTSRKIENVVKQIVSELKKPEPNSHTSVDENFFMSFVPYIKDMTENEKMDLQISILNCIKQIKNNRLNTSTNIDTQDPIFRQSSSTSTVNEVQTVTVISEAPHTNSLNSLQPSHLVLCNSRNDHDLHKDSTQSSNVIVNSSQLRNPASSTENSYQHIVEINEIKREY